MQCEVHQSGSAPGPGGCTNEMLRVCLDDAHVLDLLNLAAEDFPRGETPASRSFLRATMTALSKKDGGIRSIPTGSSFRRLVGKTLARQFGPVVEQVCAPFQFALSTRAGTDCVGHAIRVMTDLDPRATVLSVDGVGAYDHVLRSSMLGKLMEVPQLRPLIPFVRSTHAHPTNYEWEDQHGTRHQVWQHEGGEQGDPLMPLLFCLAVHNALTDIQEQLRPGEYVFAFLDDIYVVSLPERTRTVFNLAAEKLGAGAGIELHAGKTRVWNKAGECPPNVVELGDEVWNAAGIKILGTPVGTQEFAQAACAAKLEEEDKLWEATKWIPDLQCAWQVLVQCAGPRCHHLLRTLPPSHAVAYAQGHDEGMQRAMASLLEGIPGDAHQQAPAAFWASWADALPMLEKRLPPLAAEITTILEGEQVGGCLGELQLATRVLDRRQSGARPRQQHMSEPGEWPHGWQYFASSASEHHFRETVVLAQSCAADQAHLRSHSGAGASDVLCGCPTAPEFKIAPLVFRTIVCERLRLPLLLTESTCECGAALDRCGRHRAACPRSGRLKSRAMAPERTLARVCREAGAMVRTHVKLRDLNTNVPVLDDRSIEVLASGLPLHHGAQLAVDITLRSAVTSFGAACPSASRVNGVTLDRARLDKERKHHELLDGGRCHLVVVGLETSGRWSDEALHFIETLASGRPRDMVPVLRRPAFLGWRRRWIRMLSISCSRAFASSLLSSRDDVWEGTDGHARSG